MYIVTFYSFKGGVGRSMSLVNVGVQLAQAGKKVLMVDFDLEAPGLTSFSLEKPANEYPGVVDFVTNYMATGQSPDVSKFIYNSNKFEKGGEINVMSAGRQDAGYAQRLNSINWERLYAEMSGYLLFEDLKQQWKETLRPDYVLIDSRTGHSDVEGICTRQLPDAVCLLFFPNIQNLSGLKRVVRNIKADVSKRNRGIRIHHVVSNVPDLDDEDRILSDTLSRFKKELEIKDFAGEIHHYNSLSLLNQEIFSLSRPNSRLTKEYSSLVKEITNYNLSDRDAVVHFLKTVNRNFLGAVEDDEIFKGIRNKLIKIREGFATDSSVVFSVAQVFERLGEDGEALMLLSDQEIESGESSAPFYSLRARLYQKSDKESKAISDLRSMLEFGKADFESFVEGLTLIDRIAPDLVQYVPNSKAFLSLSKKHRFFIARRWGYSRKTLHLKVQVLEKMLNSDQQVERFPFDDPRNDLVLSYIGTGSFSSATDLLEENEDIDISNVFNRAMAIWGATRVPPIDLLNDVISRRERQEDYDTANFYQCLAIANKNVGRQDFAIQDLKKSRKIISEATEREFSAWSYTEVTPHEFILHLEEVEQFINGKDIVPIFIRDMVPERPSVN